MTCEEVVELMQRSLDGDLDASETSRMMEHIRTCPECAVLLERLKSLSDNLAQLPRVTPRISIVDSILPRLQHLDPASAAADESLPPVAPQEAQLPPRRRRTYRRLAGSIAAGIAAGLLIVAFPLLKPSSHADNDAASLAGGASSKQFSFSANSSNDSSAGDQAEMRKFSAKAAAPSASASAAPAPEAAQPSGSASANSAPAAGSSSKQQEGSGKADMLMAPSSIEKPLRESSPSASDDAQNTPSVQFGPPGGGAQESAPAQPAASASPSAEPSAAVTPGEDGGEPAGSGALSLVAPQTVWQSPDGLYRAAFEEQRLKVYLNSDETVLFQSEAHPEEMLEDVVWDDEQSGVLHYAWTDASGHKVELAWTAKKP